MFFRNTFDFGKNKNSEGFVLFNFIDFHCRLFAAGLKYCSTYGYNFHPLKHKEYNSIPLFHYQSKQVIRQALFVFSEILACKRFLVIIIEIASGYKGCN